MPTPEDQQSEASAPVLTAKQRRAAARASATQAPFLADRAAEEALPSAEIAEPEDKNELVSIFNKNPPGGDFVHHLYTDVRNGDGTLVGRKPGTEYRAPARDFAHVPRWVAELWKKQAPHAIVDGSAISKGKVAGPAANERVNALEGENIELKNRLSNMEKMIEELRRGDK